MQETMPAGRKENAVSKWRCPQGSTEEVKPAESQAGEVGMPLMEPSEGVLNFKFLKWLLPLQWLNWGVLQKITILFLLAWHLLSRKIYVLSCFLLTSMLY